MREHEVDDLRRHLLRRDDEVALVLAVLVVDDDDHPALAQFLERLLDGAERGRFVGHDRLRCRWRYLYCREASRGAKSGEVGGKKSLSNQLLFA